MVWHVWYFECVGILLVTYEVLHNFAQAYLNELLFHYVPQCYGYFPETITVCYVAINTEINTFFHFHLNSFV